MYRNVLMDGWCWLTVTIKGKLYFLGRTGRASDCQNLGAAKQFW